jgi:hypothetical protein
MPFQLQASRKKIVRLQFHFSGLSTRKIATACKMPNPFCISTFVAFALMACGLAGCGSINEKLAAGLTDAIPQWAGGLPADAPPRPGTAKYDEFMRERERKRLEPAPQRDDAEKVQSSSQGALY